MSLKQNTPCPPLLNESSSVLSPYPLPVFILHSLCLLLSCILQEKLRTRSYNKLLTRCQELEQKLQTASQQDHQKDAQLRFSEYIKLQKKLLLEKEKILQKAIRKAKPGQSLTFWDL